MPRKPKNHQSKEKNKYIETKEEHKCETKCLENQIQLCGRCKNEINKRKYNKQDNKEKYTCSNCDEKFESKPKLKQHNRECINPFECPITEKIFNTFTNLMTLREHLL